MGSAELDCAKLVAEAQLNDEPGLGTKNAGLYATTLLARRTKILRANGRVEKKE
ncbi:uncharacterized protein TrAFT101_002077 [Trichoderma asperellum]|uniref:uncharacterized protein n=1 Tax=Trichoderma asperellum TaxID=101201 RepID=UPI00331EC2E4|nr:hypothetical protein TrAFT101_002077 [Trichoderma asperellum]